MQMISTSNLFHPAQGGAFQALVLDVRRTTEEDHKTWTKLGMEVRTKVLHRGRRRTRVRTVPKNPVSACHTAPCTGKALLSHAFGCLLIHPRISRGTRQTTPLRTPK